MIVRGIGLKWVLFTLDGIYRFFSGYLLWFRIPDLETGVTNLLLKYIIYLQFIAYAMKQKIG